MPDLDHKYVVRLCRYPIDGIRARGRSAVLLGLFLSFCFAWAEIPKNVVIKQGVKIPVYDGTNIIAIMAASTAEPITGGKGEVLLIDFEGTKIHPTNQTIEFVVKAAECYGDGLYEPRDKRVWSAKRLEVYDGPTNYFIEGEGFVSVLGQGNATLTISNDVHTVLQREATTNNNPKPPIDIYSSHFHFVSETRKDNPKRIATYTKKVRVVDPDMNLTCEKLVAELPHGTNRVRHIEAEQNVVIRVSGGTATGQRAVYMNENGDELLRLTENPVWRDGTNEGRAEVFLFDLKTKTILANENARLKIPRSSMAAGGLFGATNTARTNDLVEISSDYFGIKTSTNRAGSLMARGNVVILSPGDQTRATSEEAFFDEAAGKLEMKGKAAWRNAQFVANGDMLEIDRKDQVFKVAANARFKTLGKTLQPGVNTAATANKTGSTNFVEIFCDSYELRTNIAQFRGNVRARFSQGNAFGNLTCHFLEVGLVGNEVESLLARGEVRFKQDQPATNVISRNISAELLVLKRSPATGFIKSMVVETNVVMLETASGKTGETQRKLSAELVTMRFAAATNSLESMIAERSVIIEMGESIATGGQAIYRLNLEGETFELSEQPQALFLEEKPDGTIQRSWWAGKTLIFDLATGRPRRFGSVKNLSAEEFEKVRASMKSPTKNLNK